MKDQAYVWFAHLVSAVFNGFFWLYFAKIIGKSEYGEIGYIISLAAVGFTFANIGLSGTMVVYGAKQQKIFSPLYQLGLLSSIVSAIIAFVLIQNIFVSIAIIAEIIWVLWESKLNSEKQYIKYARFTVLRRGLLLALSILFYHFMGIDGVLIGIALSAIPGLLGLFHFIKNKKIGISFLRPKFKIITNFYLINLTSTLFWWGDKIIIGAMFGYSVLGGYMLVTQLVILLSTLPSALYVYLLPQEASGAKSTKTKIYSVLLSCFIALIAIAVIPFGVDYVLPEHHESILAFQIVSLSVIPICISMIFESKFSGTEKNLYVLIGSSIQLGIYFTMLVIFGMIYGLTGIAIGFLIAVVSRTVWNYSINKKFFNVI